MGTRLPDLPGAEQRQTRGVASAHAVDPAAGWRARRAKEDARVAGGIRSKAGGGAEEQLPQVLRAAVDVAADAVGAGSAQRKSPLALARELSLGRRHPHVPCESTVGQTHRNKWVLDDREGSPVFHAFRFPSLSRLAYSQAGTAGLRPACGQPRGLLIGLPNISSQSRTPQTTPYTMNTIVGTAKRQSKKPPEPQWASVHHARTTGASATLVTPS